MKFEYILNDMKIIIIIIICMVILIKIVRFYYQVLNLPPGPIPLPILGNILTFRGTNTHPIITINKLNEKYGPIFTLWLGSKPYVYVYDLEIAKQLFHRKDCSGRPNSFIGEILLSNNSNDIIFSPYSPLLKAMRNNAIFSARTMAKSTQFLNNISLIVDQTINKTIDTNKEKAFSPEEILYDMNLKITFLASFGKIYNGDEEEYKVIRYFCYDFMRRIIFRMSLWEFFPFAQILDRRNCSQFKKCVKISLDIIETQLKQHKNSFDSKHIRDFCDALIAINIRDRNERKECAQHLTDENICRILFDLLLAGLETTHHTFKWCLLLLSYFPKIQQKLRQEIEREIGDKTPEYEDRYRCHYVMAFISEILRFRNVNPMAIYHDTSADIQIDKYSLAKGTGLFVGQFSIMNDQKYWSNPNQFRPERFLSDGKFVSTGRADAYLPFGIGRRKCVGEKLAVTDLFVMTVRLIQKTREYTIELINDSGLEPDSQQFWEFTPKYFEIRFKRNAENK